MIFELEYGFIPASRTTSYSPSPYPSSPESLHLYGFQIYYKLNIYPIAYHIHISISSSIVFLIITDEF